MPNRLIKESIHTSESVNRMMDFQFRLWVNLITYVDDYGWGDARPAIIRGSCFPLSETLTNGDIAQALKELAGLGSIGLYEVEGKPYLYFPSWGAHQNIRNQRSKFPAPEDACAQLHAAADKCARNPIRSESQSGSETETETGGGGGDPKAEAPGGTAPQGGASEEKTTERRSVETEGRQGAGGTPPFGTAAASGPDPDGLEAYAQSELRSLSRDNLQELLGFRARLPDELIRNAINEACASGHRNYGYVRAILNRYAERRFRTMDDLLGAEERRRSGLPVYASEDDFY